MEAEMLEVQSLPPYVEPFLQLSQEYLVRPATSW